MKRGGSHQAYNGGAIRVGNDRAFPHTDLETLQSLWVHFRNDQRDPVFHPKGGAIIHYHHSLCGSNRTERFTDRTAGAEESNVDPVKAVARELLNKVVPVQEGDGAASRALGGEHLDGSEREVSVGDDAEELLSDGAGDAYDC